MTKSQNEVHTSGKGNSNRKKVLVVDDSNDLLELSKYILESANYAVFTAMSGVQALVVLEKIELPDLIILDVQMADMSGPEFLNVFEQKCPESFKNIPVVFITGMDNPPAQKVAGFIRKPVDIDKFLAIVRQVIEDAPKQSSNQH